MFCYLLLAPIVLFGQRATRIQLGSILPANSVWDKLLKEMADYGTSIEGYVLCRPCAAALGYLPAAQRKRCCAFPCNGPAPKRPAPDFVSCPWRKSDKDSAPALLHGRYQQLLDEKLAELVGLPTSEREAKAREITAEAIPDR